MANIKLMHLQQDIMNKERMIKDIIEKNKEEKMEYEKLTQEFRSQMNLTIDIMKKNLEKENNHQEGLDRLKDVIRYQ